MFVRLVLVTVQMTQYPEATTAFCHTDLTRPDPLSGPYWSTVWSLSIHWLFPISEVPKIFCVNASLQQTTNNLEMSAAFCHRGPIRCCRSRILPDFWSNPVLLRTFLRFLQLLFTRELLILRMYFSWVSCLELLNWQSSFHTVLCKASHARHVWLVAGFLSFDGEMVPSYRVSMDGFACDWEWRLCHLKIPWGSL